MPPTDPNQKPLPLARAGKGTDLNPARTPVPSNGVQLTAVPGERAASGPPALSAAPSANALLQSLRRRWLTALVVATVGSLAATALAMVLVPGRYNAEARVLVSSRGPSNPFDVNEPQVEWSIRKNNIKGIIKSAPVLNAALRDPKVANLPVVLQQVEPAAWLESALKIEFDGSEIVRIMMSGQNPQELQLLVNAVADAYVADADQKERVRRRALLEQMEASYTRLQSDLQDKRRDLRDLLKRRGLDDLESSKLKFDLAQRRLDNMLKVASDLKGEESKLQGKIRSLKEEERKIQTDDLPDLIIDEYLKRDPAFAAYQADLSKAESELRKMAAALSDTSSPHFLHQLQKERQTVVNEIAKYRKQKLAFAREWWVQAIHEKVEDAKRELVGLQEQQASLNDELKRMEDEVRKLVPSNRALMPDVEALKDSITLTETSLTRLGDKVEAAKVGYKVIDGAPPGFSSGVILLQIADLPQQLDRGRQIKVAGGAGVGTFFMLLFGVALLEFRSRKINGADEVVRGLGMNLVGTLPALPPRARKAAPGQLSKKDQFYQNQLTESVDAIRTALLHAARTEELQVVMVTSACGGEGKTSLASHLAASLARAWRKTLLIDGDLRNPACHRLFDQPLEPGFSEVLRGEVGLNDAVRPTSVSRLWMMPAGHWDSHAVQALAQEGVRSMFEQLKEQYDFIVVDSSPVLPVADSLLLGQHVDAVVFSVLRDVSRAPAVYAAQQKLSNLGVYTLGAVVIGDSTNLGEGSHAYQGARAGS